MLVAASSRRLRVRDRLSDEQVACCLTSLTGGPRPVRRGNRCEGIPMMPNPYAAVRGDLHETER